MIKKTAYIILLMATVLSSCASQRRGPVVVDDHAEQAAAPQYDASYPEEVKPQFFYTEGIKQLKYFRNVKLAEGLFQKVIALDSVHAPSYYQLADVYAYSDPQKALQLSTKANNLDSGEVVYKAQLGRLYIVNGRYDQAKELYEQLVKISPRDPNNYSMLSALYQQTGQPYSAIATLDKAEEVLGKQQELSAYKRELLINLKLYDRAIEESQELVNSYPYSYENYLALAELYSATKKDSLAIANYAMAQNLNPEGIDVIISLNSYYKERGDNANMFATARQIMKSDEITESSKVAYIRELMLDRKFYGDNFFYMSDLTSVLLDKYPTNPDVLELAAANLVAMGEVNDAAELYKSRLDTSAPDRIIYDNIIDVETYLERADSVEKYMKMAIRDFPKDADLYIKYGGIVSYLDRDKGIKRALNVFKDAYKYAETDSLRSVVMGLMGDLYYTDEDHSRSMASYKKALKLDKDNILVLNNYAYHLSEQGKDLERALEMAERVMELEPGNPTYIDTHGWVLYKLGRYEEAKKVLQQAVALDTGNSAELLLHYGDVLHALGENYMATVYWNRALKAGYDEDVIKQRLQKAENK